MHVPAHAGVSSWTEIQSALNDTCSMTKSSSGMA